MSFTRLDGGNKPHDVFLSTDDIEIKVAEISWENRQWTCNYCMTHSKLRESAKQKLSEFLEAEIALLKIVDRMTK